MDFSSIDWNAWSAFLLTGFVIWAGVLLTPMPVVPGTLIVALGILAHKLWMGADSVSWSFVGIAFGAVVVAQLLDFALAYWGGRRFGASWKGGLGAILGGILGLSLGPIGMLAGTFAGALLFEWIDLRNHRQATRAGFGTLLGTLLAMMAKTVLSAVLALAFSLCLPVYPWTASL